jgi:hypothetical protein
MGEGSRGNGVSGNELLSMMPAGVRGRQSFPCQAGLERVRLLGDHGRVNDTPTETLEAEPWTAHGIRRSGEELAAVLGALAREHRGTVRLLLRQAWMAGESGEAGGSAGFALGRELDRWIRRAQGRPDALRGWLECGRYFTLRRKRPLRAPRAVDWGRVSVLEERGCFQLDRQARHDWLWERCSERSAGGGRSLGEGGLAARELPMGLELVWSDSPE